MIDDFALGLTQLLILVAIWRMLRRPDLDLDGAAPPVVANDLGFGPGVGAPRPGQLQMVPLQVAPLGENGRA